MTTLDLFQQLYTLGVKLTPHPDGTIRCRGPQHVLTTDVVDTMRQHKSELHALVEAFEERAAIAEYCGGLSRAEAERLAKACLLTSHDGCAACGMQDATGAVA